MMFGSLIKPAQLASVGNLQVRRDCVRVDDQLGLVTVEKYTTTRRKVDILREHRLIEATHRTERKHTQFGKICASRAVRL